MRNSYNKRGNIRFTLDNQVKDWRRVGGYGMGLLSRQQVVDDNSGTLNV